MILFGRLSEQVLVYVFLAGLPTRVKQFLWANSSVDSLALDELLDEARTILQDDSASEEPIIPTTQTNQNRATSGLGTHTGVFCYKCSSQGHVARNCMGRNKGMHMCCYQCNEARHMAQDCLGNEARDMMALTSSPDNI